MRFLTEPIVLTGIPAFSTPTYYDSYFQEDVIGIIKGLYAVPY